MDNWSFGIFVLEINPSRNPILAPDRIFTPFILWILLEPKAPWESSVPVTMDVSAHGVKT